ncbi:MAG: hypothetical protein Q8P20_07775 [bacterium]|nr:hypothetical protein [bacterium]
MKKNNLFLITFFIIISCFWIFWYPGVKVATDYHLSFNAGLVGALPWSWREFNVADGMGEYTTFILWSQPLQSLSEVMSSISLGDEVQTKLKGFVIIVLGFIGLWKLLAYLKINDWGKGIGATFFILNSFFLLMFDGGQFSLNLVYITLPFVLLSFMNLLKTAKWKERVKFSLMVLLVSILDIRVVFLLLIILGIYLIFKISYKLLPNLLTSFVFTVFILIGFHAYWIFPSILSKTPSLPLTYDRLSQVNFLSFSSIGHSIFLQQPHWYKNIFGQINHLQFEFIVIPILVFLAPILVKKNRMVGFWLMIALIGIFLSKGSQDPFGGIYLWLFGHFPGFSLFRDPVKFYFLTALAYSVLIGFTINAVSKLKFAGKVANFGIKVFPYLIFLYLLFMVCPIYLGWMTGMISKPIYFNEYKQLSNILKANHKFSRILWVPSQAPLGYSSLDHPPIQASNLTNKRPFAIGTKGTYELFSFLREAPYMGEIFDVAGIGYIAYPPLDPRRDDMHPDNIKYYYTFSDQLSKRSWLTKITDSPVPLFKVSQHQDRFFITPNIWWVIGSDNLYNGATKSAKLKLSQNALIFSEEYPGFSQRLDELPEAKIVLNNKTNIDLAANFISSSSVIFPATTLNFDPNKISGWWKREAADLISWRVFLKEKYGIDNQDFDLGGGWAVGEGSLKLKVKSEKLKVNQILLARVLESTRSGVLKFSQNGQEVGSINTKKEGNNVRWFEVGKLISHDNLTISSGGDINVVNALAILDKDEWTNYQEKAKMLQGRIVSFDEKNAQNDNNSKITYRKVNPTKYIVNVSNLTNSSFLVFSQNYDGLWKINGQGALPVYSLLNGFKIEKDGEYTVEFEAQKFVFPGLIISGLTLGGLVLLYLFTSTKPARAN